MQRQIVGKKVGNKSSLIHYARTFERIVENESTTSKLTILANKIETTKNSNQKFYQIIQSNEFQ